MGTARSFVAIVNGAVHHYYLHVLILVGEILHQLVGRGEIQLVGGGGPSTVKVGVVGAQHNQSVVKEGGVTAQCGVLSSAAVVIA